MATMARKILPTPTSVDRTSAYAQAVVDGEIVAGPHVRNACRRHLDDLEYGPKRGLWFDYEAADRVFGFFEDVLKLSEGQFEGQPFKLQPMQEFILGSLFGWKREDGRRRFRRAYIEAGKGCGKSPLAGGIGLYGLTSDGEAGAQIYAAASKTDQAQVLFQDACKMVRAAPALAKRLQFSGGIGREFNIAHLASGSFFRPVSREAGKSGSGPRPYFVLADEVHEMPDAKILEMLERGFKFRRDPLLLMITNSGSDRKSVAWAQHERGVKVAAGNIDAVTDPAYLGNVIDDSTFAYICALDEGDDPLTDPSCWAKANPLLGVTITEDYLAEQVAEAKAIPGSLNGILRLHFCVWTDAETAWMSRATLEPAIADFDPAIHHGKSVTLGIDLSKTRDFTAKAVVVETGEVSVERIDDSGQPYTVVAPTYDAWVEIWTPGDTLEARSRTDRADYYLVWQKEGWIKTPKGESISYRHVAQSVAEDAHNFKIMALGYDRYAYRSFFEPELNALGLSVEQVEHPQGGTKKGKPTEAMAQAAKAAGREPEGLWMPSSVKSFEQLLLERRIRIKRNPAVISAIMSAVTDSDRWDNYWLAKERSANKIDAAVALCMAIGVIMAYPNVNSVDDWIASYSA
jgi:phage terminase large subunit-like protein